MDRDLSVRDLHEVISVFTAKKGVLPMFAGPAIMSPPSPAPERCGGAYEFSENTAHEILPFRSLLSQKNKRRGILYLDKIP
jgi:hypothetical protein